MNQSDKEKETFEFKAVMQITLNGKNTRVQRDEIQAIFESARAKAETMNIDAELTNFDR